MTQESQTEELEEILEQLNKEWKEHIEDEYTSGYVGRVRRGATSD